MSVTQSADLVINWLGFGLLFWLSAAAIVRWIRRGRIESYSWTELMPKWLPRWALGAAEPGRRSTTGGITVWGWLLLGCIAVWLLNKAVESN